MNAELSHPMAERGRNRGRKPRLAGGMVSAERIVELEREVAALRQRLARLAAARAALASLRSRRRTYG